ncbi:hypothetical protein [Streptomyces sp. NPDC052015]|uniref:hypothetical protein n=1 Tax=Streptomyces sp. NPDC052015 TaxID=3154755 RepID=UPI00344406C7
MILLFLALPIVVILVTSFSNNAFASFPPEAWTLNWYMALFTDDSKWPAALSLSALVFALVLGRLSSVVNRSRGGRSSTAPG